MALLLTGCSITAQYLKIDFNFGNDPLSAKTDMIYVITANTANNIMYGIFPPQNCDIVSYLNISNISY